MKKIIFLFAFLFYGCQYTYVPQTYYRGCCPQDSGNYTCEEHSVICENGQTDEKCYCTSRGDALEYSGLNQYQLYVILSNYRNMVFSRKLSFTEQRNLWDESLLKAYKLGYSIADVEACLDLLGLTPPF